MADFKEYRSVTEFPAQTEALSREELIENYNDLRETYKSLTSSRGQLVRRQRESKEKIVDLNQNIQEKSQQLEEKEQQLTTASDKLQTAIISLEQKDRELLQRQEEINRVSSALEKSKQSLAKIEKDKRLLLNDINELNSERQVIAALVRNLKSEYSAVQNEAGLLGTVHRLRRMMSAVSKFLNTDITEIVKQQKREIEEDESLKENSRNIGKNLLDDK